jgi:hypothetical protein
MFAVELALFPLTRLPSKQQTTIVEKLAYVTALTLDV